jgi:hypothetical protein
MPYVAKLEFGKHGESCGTIHYIRRNMFDYLRILTPMALVGVAKINVYRCADPCAHWDVLKGRFDVSGANMHLIDRFEVKGGRVIISAAERATA